MRADEVGARLRAIRLEAGLTQDALAGRTGSQQSVISDYENGRCAPSLRTLARLLGAMGHELEFARRGAER